MKLCIFCNKEAVKKGSCYVCEDCKTVVLTKSPDDIINEIKISIDSIQSHIDSVNDYYLHGIMQRHINGEQLSKEELEKILFAEEFQRCRLVLDTFMRDGVQTDDITYRQNMYKLLELGLNFKKVFDEECHIIEI